MSEAVVATFVMTTTLWVYWDATRHRIGHVPGVRSIFNRSAGTWAAVTLLLWIVGFPAYLLNRPALIQRARQHPVVAKNRVLKLALLAVAGIVLMGLSMPRGSQAPVPDPAASATDEDPFPPR